MRTEFSWKSKWRITQSLHNILVVRCPENSRGKRSICILISKVSTHASVFVYLIASLLLSRINKPRLHHSFQFSVLVLVLPSVSSQYRSQWILCVYLNVSDVNTNTNYSAYYIDYTHQGPHAHFCTAKVKAGSLPSSFFFGEG